ncbi:MAG TPA: cytochrome C peroxidase [Candidatus Methylomirabilis sp.]|nr:cytochrome C peroxidase [Candidatus Methylomirabilis sp.]
MNLSVRVVVVSTVLFVASAGVALAKDLESSFSLAEAQNPCATKNPCAVKNPCANNPCAAKNPCAAANRVNPKLVTRPAGTKRSVGERTELVKLGEGLWSSTRLSTNGLSCQTCHRGNAGFNATFAQPYPHMVAMPKDRAGLKTVHADEMVQFCMVVPMAAKPLPWNSKELAALIAYTVELQKTFRPAANPCAMKNPCAPKNPCATNPCNPCAPER